MVANRMAMLDHNVLIAGHYVFPSASSASKYADNLVAYYTSESEFCPPDADPRNPDVQCEVYAAEVLQMCRPNSYVPLWALHGLATVLQSPVHSVFPETDEEVHEVTRHYSHRVILPVGPALHNPVTIMWTMGSPNLPGFDHFVPLVK